MSGDKSTGQIAGGIIGAAIGFFAGSGNLYTAFQGYVIGSGIGGLVDPPPGPNLQGPRLDDLNAQTSSYGSGVARIYGDKIAVSGTIIWVRNNQITEVARKKKVGGKGGGGKTTVTEFSYFATFAIALAESDQSTNFGPAALDRMWIANRLYLYSTSSDDGTALASLKVRGPVSSAIADAIAAGTSSTWVRFYNGSDDQDIDPEIEADLGAGATPAYRGTAIMVVYNLPLADYGNSLMGAQVKAEIINSATFSYSLLNQQTVSPDRDSNVAAVMNYVDADFVAHFFFPAWTSLAAPSLDYFYVRRYSNNDTLTVLRTAAEKGGILYRFNSDQPVFFMRSQSPPRYLFSPGVSVQFDVNNDADVNGTTTGAACYVDSRLYTAGQSTGRVYRVSGSGIEATSANSYSDLFAVSKFRGGGNVLAFYGSGIAELHPDTLAEVDTYAFSWTVSTESACRASVDSLGIIYVITNGASPVLTVINGADFSVMNTYSVSEIALLDSETSIVFENLVGIFTTVDGTGWDTRVILLDSQQNQNVTLQNAVAQICTEVETIGAGDLDVSLLSGNCSGIRVSGPSTARSVLSILQARYLFDIIPSGYKIKFVPRPQTSSQSITEDELVRNGDSFFQLQHNEEVQLPRKYSVKYLDAGREYDTNEQFSPEYPGNGTVSVSPVELPMVMTADEAAQLAEILMELKLLERDSVPLVLPPPYRNIEPSDVITLTTNDSFVYQIRCESVHLRADGTVEIEGKLNSQSSYSSSAVGSAGIMPDEILSIPAPPIPVLMDIPLMRDADDEPGFAVAVGAPGGIFNGAVLYLSNDGGQSWNDLQGFSNVGTFGFARDPLSEDSGYLIDYESELVVDMVCGELSSISKTTMLSGQNYAAYGADGRWEILQFMTATLGDNNQYTFSGFLRGQKGTEWSTGLHEQGDAFVWLDDADNAFIQRNLADIGINHLFTAAASGSEIDSGAQVEFSYDGVNLKPLSVVHGSAEFDAPDWVFNFFPRTRYSSSWWGTGVPAITDTPEVYEIDIIDNNESPAVVVRTITITNPTQNSDGSISETYTSAQQIEDFGGIRAVIDADIYQVSASVGRGYVHSISATAALDPVELFGSGELGAIYDASDISTLFTDTGGTTPVTMDGDLVAYMADKSGNGHHAVQATSGARPIYRTNGVHSWLEGDGSRYMTVSGSDSALKFLHGSGPLTIFGGVKPFETSNPNTNCGFLGTSGWSTASNRVGMTVGFDDRASSGVNNKITYFVSRGVTSSPATTDTLTAQNNTITFGESHAVTIFGGVDAGSDVRFYVDDANTWNENYANSPSSANSLYNLDVMAAGNGTLPLVGRFIAAVCIDRRVTIAERKGVEAWIYSRLP